MLKIWLITKREYLSRVSKKSFIVMTILGPLLIGIFYTVIIGIAINEKTGEKVKTIAVDDQSGLFENRLENPSKVNFVYPQDNSENSEDDIYGWLIIPEDFTLEKPTEIKFKSTQTPTIDLQGKLVQSIESVAKNQRLLKNGIRQTYLDSLKVDIKLSALEINEHGELIQSNSGIKFGIALGFAFLIYLFVLLYGVQVMRGVMEEKTNRIVEIIISSVKPFQLMMGKILGLALVGLTQFLIWIVLSGILMSVVSMFFISEMTNIQGQIPTDKTSIPDMTHIFGDFFSLNITYYLLVFVFYFLFGYLLYGSMFAAIGSSVDSEADTQQFMLPVTIPLVISFVASMSILSSDPNGTLATFMSIFPLSSPIVMMVRLPFNPPVWELVISMLTLILTFILFTWLAGRIYKVGILMMGKKPTYKQLFKWMLMK
jgi:ABC-2 type transport system permease protein